jgi:hypothetical protein
MNIHANYNNQIFNKLRVQNSFRTLIEHLVSVRCRGFSLKICNQAFSQTLDMRVLNQIYNNNKRAKK